MFEENLSSGENLFDQPEFNSLQSISDQYGLEKIRAIAFVFGFKIAERFYKANNIAPNTLAPLMLNLDFVRKMAYEEIISGSGNIKLVGAIDGMPSRGKKIDAVREIAATAYDSLESEAMWPFYIYYCFANNYNSSGTLLGSRRGKIFTLKFSSWQNKAIDRMRMSRESGLDEITSQLGYSRAVNAPAGKIGPRETLSQMISADLLGK